MVKKYIQIQIAAVCWYCATIKRMLLHSTEWRAD